MRISDWSSDVCSSDLILPSDREGRAGVGRRAADHQHELVRPREAVGDRLQLSHDRGHQLYSEQLLRRQSLAHDPQRSEEHTSELQSLMRISYAVFCLKKKTTKNNTQSIKKGQTNTT